MTSGEPSRLRVRGRVDIGEIKHVDAAQGSWTSRHMGKKKQADAAHGSWTSGELLT